MIPCYSEVIVLQVFSFLEARVCFELNNFSGKQKRLAQKGKKSGVMFYFYAMQHLALRLSFCFVKELMKFICANNKC